MGCGVSVLYQRRHRLNVDHDLGRRTGCRIDAVEVADLFRRVMTSHDLGGHRSDTVGHHARPQHLHPGPGRGVLGFDGKSVGLAGLEFPCYRLFLADVNKRLLLGFRPGQAESLQLAVY